MDENRQGLIQVYTGNGKGKTTAALGQAMRAAGRGLRVGFIQFVKGEPYGEHLFASRYCPFQLVQVSAGSSFVKPTEQLAEDARRTLTHAREQMLSGACDLLVLDEVFIAIKKGLITTTELLALLDEKPAAMELVLTGRYAPAEIIERADLVTEMQEVKHPYSRGIPARLGIEF